MPKCVINRYFRGIKTDHVFLLNGHVTVTGKEDHFSLAYHDAAMILRGMQEADKISMIVGDDEAEVETPRYWLQSVSMD